MIDSNRDKKVSVVMCTYNGAAFLREQLDTIINQTYPIYEIIVQDDGSTDETINILESYKERYPIVKLYKNVDGRGVNTNFFSALKRATGDYIAISDQDDIWELDKIEKQITFIGESWLCFHFSKPFSEDGVPIAFDNRIPNYSLPRMIFFNMVPGHTMFMKKELLECIVDEKCFLYDALLALAAGVSDRIIFIPEVLVNHRRYGNAYSYHKPVSNSRSIQNIIHYIFCSINNMIHNKIKMVEHFNAMYMLLSKYKGQEEQTPYFTDMLNLSDLFRHGDFLSMTKAAFICLKYRNSIFYTRTKDGLSLRLRALFHPILMSQYYK